MRRFIIAAVSILLAGQALALQLKVPSQGGRPPSAQSTQTSYGPYYLAVNGYCDVFQVWYDPYLNTVFGNDVGCPGMVMGQPALGTIDSDGYDVYLSVGGSTQAILVDFDLYDGVAAWGVSGGGNPMLHQGSITLSTSPIAAGAGPSIIQ